MTKLSYVLIDCAYLLVIRGNTRASWCSRLTTQQRELERVSVHGKTRSKKSEDKCTRSLTSRT